MNNQPNIPVQEKVFERRGISKEPAVRHYPQVIGGVCEYHGVIDSTRPSTEQFRLCPNDGKHPRWTDIRCSYCDETKDPMDVLYHSYMNITDSPDNPNEIIAVCNSYTCSQKHQARFRR